MATLTFQDIAFHEEKDKVDADFLKIFRFSLDKAVLRGISDFSIEKNSITFSGISEKKAINKFNKLLAEGFRHLKNRVSNHRTVYIHKNSGIPLAGSLAFGIVDKGSSMLEIKPMTSCNIACVFCSVDEGPGTKKVLDFVVEKDYIVQELARLMAFKGHPDTDIYINTHGEPTLYADMPGLVSDISKIDGIKVITIITNGTLLTRPCIDELVDAGLNQLNLSLNAISPEKTVLLAGVKGYNIEKVKDIAKYAAKKLNLVIAPVLVHGLNDNEMPKIIEFAKSIGAKVFIQNFMEFKRGRNPSDEWSFEAFEAFLKSLEKAHNISLSMDFKPVKTKEYGIPFKKGETVKVPIVCDGRYPNEKLGALRNRSITIHNCFGSAGSVKVKLTRVLHNIIEGIAL